VADGLRQGGKAGAGSSDSQSGEAFGQRHLHRGVRGEYTSAKGYSNRRISHCCARAADSASAVGGERLSEAIGAANSKAGQPEAS
jgi:hypothetical protein